MDFKKVVQKWNGVVNCFEIKIENTKTFELFCIYMEYLITTKEDNKVVLKYKDDVIKNIKDFNHYPEVKTIYNEISGKIEYITIEGNVLIYLNTISKESIKTIFGDVFFQFLVVNGYVF